jgi:hypothetical protein
MRIKKLAQSALAISLIALTGVSPAELASTQQSRNVKVAARTADGKPLPLYNASFALVVGVANYTNGWPRLDEAVNDAREVKTALEEQGFVVTLVENPAAVQLKDAIESFLATHGLSKETRLLFYFAGHGHTQTI